MKPTEGRRLTSVGGVFATACVVATLWALPAARAEVITRRQALARPDVVVVRGETTDRWRECSADDRTYDLRRFRSVGSFDDLANLSIGNDCAASGVVTVGGAAAGTISHSLTWQEVKASYDAAGLRFEGTSWLAAFGVSLQNVEDGFVPRVTEGTEADNRVAFLLSGAYMDWIRDDAIEDDDLMSGVIRDVLIDGTNRFLSARPSESAAYTNHAMIVEIRDVLVHMKAMHNGDAKDGKGFGGVFKWSDAAGRVDMSNAIFLLDERPLGEASFPPGRYAHVKLVLDFQGRYPGDLPDGVSVTHRLAVWRHARSGWIRAHRKVVNAARSTMLAD